MIKILKSLLNIFLVLFFVMIFSAQARAEASEPPAPTLIAPNEKTATANLKPLITGLTKNDTVVKIFIDDTYSGQTVNLKNDSGTANFAYEPPFNLSRGRHKIQALAEDSEGKISLMSDVLNFIIELSMPAPTILKPVVNKSTSFSRPFIVGLAKNNSKIKVYIDKKYQGEFLVKNHPSGTANFAYKPIVALKRGSHTVYAVAIDRRGKESIWSNTVNFTTKNSAIAQAVQEERAGAAVSIKDLDSLAEVKPEPVVISGDSGAVLSEFDVNKQKLENKNQTAIEKVKNLIGAGTEADESTRGMINEGKQNQGRLKLSLILFILFFIGVIAWLLWVNRELAKERREQNEIEKELKTDDYDSTTGEKAPPVDRQENKLL